MRKKIEGYSKHECLNLQYFIPSEVRELEQYTTKIEEKLNGISIKDSKIKSLIDELQRIGRYNNGEMEPITQGAIFVMIKQNLELRNAEENLKSAVGLVEKYNIYVNPVTCCWIHKSPIVVDRHMDQLCNHQLEAEKALKTIKGDQDEV